MARRRRRKTTNRAGKIGVSIMVIALVAILSVQIVRVYHQNETYKKQEAQLQEELAEVQQRAEDLQAEEEYVGSDQYVEDVARTKLGMVYEDEILFKEN